MTLVVLIGMRQFMIILELLLTIKLNYFEENFCYNLIFQYI